MIVSYQTGMEFLQDNQAYLQTNPYLSTFFTLDAPLLKQADKINYALRCEQGDKRLLALKPGMEVDSRRLETLVLGLE